MNENHQQPVKSEKNKAKQLALFLKKELTFGKSKIGITRANKSLSKKNRCIVKNSKKINRLKKRHKMTNKEKKSR